MSEQKEASSPAPRRRRSRVLAGFVAVLVVCGLVALGAIGARYVDRGQNQTGPSSASAAGTTSSSATSNSASSSATPVQSVTQVAFPDVAATWRGSAEGVATAAVRSLTTWDAATDASEDAAFDRTRPLFGAWLSKQGPAHAAGSGQGWPQEVSTAGAFSKPEVSTYRIAERYQAPNAEGTGKDAQGRPVQTVQLRSDWTWMSPEGHVVPVVGSRVYTVQVVKDAGRWSVLDYSYRDLQAERGASATPSNVSG